MQEFSDHFHTGRSGLLPLVMKEGQYTFSGPVMTLERDRIIAKW
ncbi:MAG: hypothetical protein ACRD5B_13890 [Nitrososphaeraceae archaeon]